MPFINNVDWAEFLDCAKLEARVRWWRRLCPPHIAGLRDRPVQPTQGATLGAFRSVARSLILHDASPPVRRVAEQPHAQGLDPLAEIGVTLCSPDIRLMRNKTSSELIDFGTLRLQRAAKRLQQQDHAGAVEDLRAALQHTRGAGADPLEVEHLTSIIAATERQAS